MGAERTSAYIPEDVKRSTAVHEGGHALVALYTPGSMPLHKVTCIPRGHALGMVGSFSPGLAWNSRFDALTRHVDATIASE
jgi:ATP-dependent metalloprotease